MKIWKAVRLNGTASGAREAAWTAIQEWRETGAFLQRTLETVSTPLNPPDRRLAQELAYGVVRRQATLDALLMPHVSRPPEKVEAGLWGLLQLGAYQLVLLEGIPTHAAVHATVEIARRIGQPRWVGFANAVLRRVSENVTDQTAASAAADAVPLTAGVWRKLRRPVFPEPSRKPTEFLAAAFSLPIWLVERWVRRFSHLELEKLAFAMNAPSPIWLRTNVCRTTRERFLETLRAAGIAAEPGQRSVSVRLLAPAPIESLPGFREGWFTVQDETAMAAAELLSPQPGSQVLDLCAAPGTKTTHLAERMANQGRIIATDPQPERLKRVDENAARLGHAIIQTRTIRDDGEDIPTGPFDSILLDVPCSNTGVLARRPEARWRLTPHDLVELPRIQRGLLNAAIARLKPAGRLVYSTCSIEPEENQEIIQAALRSRPGVRLISEQEFLPGQPSDGGYQALLQRN